MNDQMFDPPENDDYLAEAIKEAYGERCPDLEPACLCCRAWQQYDDWKMADEVCQHVAKDLIEAFHSSIPNTRAHTREIIK